MNCDVFCLAALLWPQCQSALAQDDDFYARLDDPEEPTAEMVELLASYHTHGPYPLDAGIEVPSSDDLIGDIELGLDGHLGTPHGRLWLNNAADGVALLLCGPGRVTVTPTSRNVRR